MSIAIVVSAHGSVAEQLLKTAEMILGAQKNTAWINFVPGENTEILIKKYTDILINLKIKKGAIFFVDIWGGSPFNAANQISFNKENYDVIAGVNIPMLVEVFMARDDNTSLKELVRIAIESGRIGIKSLERSTMEKKQITNNQIETTNQNKYMNIILTRIDDRLIHGQVATTWAKETNIKRIIVVNNSVANDKVRKTLLTQVAPPGITAHVVSLDKFIRVYNNPKYADERVMLLFTNPDDIVYIINNGVKIGSVNIGGMAFNHEKTQVNSAISLSQKDVKAFILLNKLGIELEVRKVPSDTKLYMMDLIKNSKLDVIPAH